MGYRRMTETDLKVIYRRWKSGQSISFIESAEGFTRKTIRKYISIFIEKNWLNQTPSDNDFSALLTPNQRTNRMEDELNPHLSEIKQLVSGDKANNREPMKPKTAYLVVKEKYGLRISYESFKLFARKEKITQKEAVPTVRVELPPGEELQIDYGKVGTHFDPKTNKNRTVHAFAGILSCSRLTFVQFVYSVDQESFVQSHVDMFKYYDGVPEYLTIDNLKTGVIKPDIYDPRINRSYMDMAEHYNTFINPCRIRRPQDKGKVERIIPVMRELFRRLKALYPTKTLSELNREALIRCREELGMKKHGTTGQIPYLFFQNVEKNRLKLLPEPFIIPVWKEVSVGLDQFFQFEKRLYSLPASFIRKRVWVCRKGKTIQVFFENKPVRLYYPDNDRKYFHHEDFPNGIHAIVEGTYPHWLKRQAENYGKDAADLIEMVLKPHAALNARRARGLLTLMEQNHHLPYFARRCRSALAKRITSPKSFKVHLLMEEDESCEKTIQMSSLGQAMTRDSQYYLS